METATPFIHPTRSNLKKYLYLVNIGLYSLMVYLSIFTAKIIMRWWLDDQSYQLNYASFIWLPIGLLILNPLIWSRVYPTIILQLSAIGLLFLNLVGLSFIGGSYRLASLLGWGVITLISIAMTVYGWYTTKPWLGTANERESTNV